MAQLLAVPPDELTASDTRASVKRWSSLADIEILTAIASEPRVDAEPLHESVGELWNAPEEQQAFSA